MVLTGKGPPVSSFWTFHTSEEPAVWQQCPGRWQWVRRIREAPGQHALEAIAEAPFALEATEAVLGNLVPRLGAWLCSLQVSICVLLLLTGKARCGLQFLSGERPQVLECSVAPLPQERRKGCRHRPSTWVSSSGSPFPPQYTFHNFLVVSSCLMEFFNHWTLHPSTPT